MQNYRPNSFNPVNNNSNSNANIVSPDGKHIFNNGVWVPISNNSQSLFSPDGKYHWDGTAWVSVPKFDRFINRVKNMPLPKKPPVGKKIVRVIAGLFASVILAPFFPPAAFISILTLIGLRRLTIFARDSIILSSFGAQKTWKGISFAGQRIKKHFPVLKQKSIEFIKEQKNNRLELYRNNKIIQKQAQKEFWAEKKQQETSLNMPTKILDSSLDIEQTKENMQNYENYNFNDIDGYVGSVNAPIIKETPSAEIAVDFKTENVEKLSENKHNEITEGKNFDDFDGLELL